MALSLTVVPSVEPLTTAEAKTALRIDHSNDDTRIANFIIPAARQLAEGFTRRAFLNQTYVLRLLGFGTGPIVLPACPISSVTSIAYVDTAGDSQTWASSNYTVETPSGDLAGHGSIRPVYSVVYPSTRTVVDAVTITFVAGYGAAASAVPVGIKEGVSHFCRYLYDSDDDARTQAHEALAPYVVERFDLRFD